MTDQLPTLTARPHLFDRLHLPSRFLFTAATIAALALHAFWYDFTSDDAFIVARYARNLAEGLGCVWNPGERVEGYTSIVWVLLCAGIGRTGLDYAIAARGLSLLGAAGSVIVLIRLASPLGLARNSGLAFAAPALFVLSASVACWALGGLETCGFAFSILLLLLILTRNVTSTRSAPAAGFAAGFCALVRPEGLAVAVIAGLWYLARPGKGSARRLAEYAAILTLSVLAHLAWRRAYYGDWLPNTYYAKVGHGPPVWRAGARYAWECFSDNGGIAAWVLPFIGPWLFYRHRKAAGFAIVGLTLIAGVIFVGGDGLAMDRFIVPIIPLWLLLWVKLLSEIPDWIARTLPRIPAGAGRVLVYVIIIALATSLAFKPRTARQYLLYTEHIVEVPDWIAVGRWLHENAPPDASVACVPIGAVGYYSRLTVFDMLGLTDHHIARRELPLGGGWVGHEKHDGPYILSRRPTYLFLGNIQVLGRPLSAGHKYFAKPPNPNIAQREGDIFTPELLAEYAPAVARLENGRYLHYLVRREAEPPREPGGKTLQSAAPAASRSAPRTSGRYSVSRSTGTRPASRINRRIRSTDIS